MNLTTAQQLQQATDPREIGRLQAAYQLEGLPHTDLYIDIAKTWRREAMAKQKNVKSEAKRVALGAYIRTLTDFILDGKN